METEPLPPRIELAEMPSQELLEEFLTNMHYGLPVTVYYNTEKKMFEKQDV